jgi:hypothetical protein
MAENREVQIMSSLRALAHHESGERAQPLVHWAAATSAAAITATLALIVGALWTAAAFSSHNSGFYNHLDWWFGGTVIGAAFVASVVAGGIASPRGMAAGVVNGLTSWAIIALAAAAVILVAVAAGATTATLSLKTGNVAVGLIRPYVVFWASVIGTGVAVLGGVAGGLLPRRGVALSYTDVTDVSTVRSSRVAAGSRAAS